MGCVNSNLVHPTLKNDITNVLDISNKTKIFNNDGNINGILVNEKSIFVKIQVREAIKKKDIFLFKRVLDQYKINLNENLSNLDQPLSILHEICRYNFVNGIRFVLEEMSKKLPQELCTKLINMQDINGNNPAMLCCKFKSVKTLEILFRCDWIIDFTTKNQEGKTFSNLVQESGQPFIELVECLAKIRSNSVPEFAMISQTECISGMVTSQLDRLNPRRLSKFNKGIQKESLNKIRSIDPSNTLLTTDDGICLSPPSTEKDSTQKILASLQTFNPDNPLIKSDSIKKIALMISQMQSSKSRFKDIDFNKKQSLLIGIDDMNKKDMIEWSESDKIFNKKGQDVNLYIYNEFIGISLNNFFGTDSILCTVLCVLMEYPSRIIKIFNTKTYNTQGILSINLYDAGISKEIIIDDEFPVINKHDPIYIKPKSNELWSLIIEKCLVKLYGSYHIIHKYLSIDELFETILGTPIYIRLFNNITNDNNNNNENNNNNNIINDIWKELLEYDQKNYIILLCKLKDKNNIKSITNIMSIISLYEYNQYKVIKLKNHGIQQYIWKGDFSKNSKLWNKKLKENFDYIKEYDDDNRNNNNIIYMKIEDIINQFNYMNICYYYDDWYRIENNIEFNNNHAIYYELKINKNNECYIYIYQQSIHIINNTNSFYYPIEIKIAKKLDDNLHSIAFSEYDGLFGKRVTNFTNKNPLYLEEGIYILRVKFIINESNFINNNNNNNNYPFINYNNISTLVIHSKYPVQLKKNDIEIWKNYLQFFFLDYATRYTYINYNIYYMGNDCDFTCGWCDMHLWIAVINKSNDIWDLTIEFGILKNLKLSKYHKFNDTTFNIRVLPKSKTATCAKRIDINQQVKFTWKFKNNWSSQQIKIGEDQNAKAFQIFFSYFLFQMNQLTWS